MLSRLLQDPLASRSALHALFAAAALSLYGGEV
jgi:hypothetical protein